MGHSSSIVRQHAGQVFLKLYYQLPEEVVINDDEINTTKIHRNEKDHFGFKKKQKDEIIDDSNVMNNRKTNFIMGSKEQILEIISISILDNKKWQRQEIGLIISEEIINKKLLEYLNGMKNKNWERKKILKDY